MAAALYFYTETLDFELWKDDSPADAVVNLFRGEAELMLTTLPMDQAPDVSVIVIVRDVDELFARWCARGLDQSHRTESPVHLAPIDQSWGTREVYVADPFGNTLRLVQR